METINIEKWINQVINGTGGFKSLEEHELPIYKPDKECGIAEFVIRALANTKCKGSADVLNAILKHRGNGNNIH